MADGRYLFQVTAEYEEERIDKYISLLIDSLSRSFIQKLLRDGQVLVNGKPVKQNYRLNEGDEVSFSFLKRWSRIFCRKIFRSIFSMRMRMFLW